MQYIFSTKPWDFSVYSRGGYLRAVFGLSLFFGKFAPAFRFSRFRGVAEVKKKTILMKKDTWNASNI